MLLMGSFELQLERRLQDAVQELLIVVVPELDSSEI